jgi:hypothetical protein
MEHFKNKFKTDSYEDLGHYHHYHHYSISNQFNKSLNKVVKG